MGGREEEQLLIRGRFLLPPEYYEFFFRRLKCYDNKEQETLSLLMCRNDERKSRKTAQCFCWVGIQMICALGKDVKISVVVLQLFLLCCLFKTSKE